MGRTVVPCGFLWTRCRAMRSSSSRCKQADRRAADLAHFGLGGERLAGLSHEQSYKSRHTVDTNRSGMPEHVALPNTVDTNRSGMPEHVALPNTAEQMAW